MRNWDSPDWHEGEALLYYKDAEHQPNPGKGDRMVSMAQLHATMAVARRLARGPAGPSPQTPGGD